MKVGGWKWGVSLGWLKRVVRWDWRLGHRDMMRGLSFVRLGFEGGCCVWDDGRG